MCELFGAVLNNGGCPNTLEKFRYFALQNPDGWGIAWYTKRKLHLEKSIKSAWWDTKYQATLRNVKSKLILAHLRKMSIGNIREVNTHPFIFGKYVFAHNGSVDVRPLVEYLKGKYKQIKGTTDSEVLFHFIIQNMEKWGNFMGLRKAVKEINKVTKERKVTSINFLMTDGRYLYAYKRNYRGKNNLYFKKKGGFNKYLLFSSKPIEHGWTELENGELMVVDSLDLSVIRTKIL